MIPNEKGHPMVLEVVDSPTQKTQVVLRQGYVSTERATKYSFEKVLDPTCTQE
jgi:hypothetical protein